MYKVFYIVGVLLLTSCFNDPQENGSREILPDPEKYVHDGYLAKPDSLQPIFVPDTMVGLLSLINSTNVDSTLGENVMDKLVDGIIPYSSIVSSDSKQRLTYYFHPGNVKKEFSEFKIDYVDQVARDEVISSLKEFSTESGIKLGMTMGSLRSLKGEPTTIKKNETTVFRYKIQGFIDSEFLKKYNMPIYYANYVFNNGYLVEFKFGFEYP